jgi:hypothetical protein
LIALLALIASLLSSAMPGFAAVAPAPPQQLHAAMGCDGHDRPQPAHHMPGSDDCCVANICAMNLALPAAISGIAQPFPPGAPRYDLRVLLQPVGIDAAPIPHPPKAAA